MALRNSDVTGFVDKAQKSYDQVYEVFRRLATNEGTTADVGLNRTKAFQVSVDPLINDEVEIVGRVKLERLPYRHGTAVRAAPIYVIIKSKERYKLKRGLLSTQHCLVKAHVLTSYYSLAKVDWKSILSVRYDFDDADQAHPIFHAQMEDGKPDAELGQLFPSLPKVDPVKIVHKGIRIPSANMIGATALLKLAADHLPTHYFVDVLKEIRKQQIFADWTYKCETLDDPESPKLLLSSGWYSTK